jgi:methylated-DNA-[protein]-cysteine S-methyltransferase
VAVLWTLFYGCPKVARVILSSPGIPAEQQMSELFPDSEPASCNTIDALCAGIAAFLDGQRIDFSLDLAQLDLCPPFQQAVLRTEHAIPRGSVSTYSLLAASLGKPRAARAVGNALAHNPFPIIVPCHRAIRSDRALGGYQGGLAMKRALLENEGIEFDAKGRVAYPHLHYGNYLGAKTTQGANGRE